ncbi:MAG: MotA/TolQ/ExbB proton channel family protein [Oscillatoriales cyanobacterium]|nr:MAG: MotA/TolQ/ExbB proton channel family protein [Oscillatoriales cyanobacterium]
MDQNLLTSSGIVAIPLVGFSLISFMLIIERFYYWSEIWRREKKIINQVFSLLEHDRLSAIALLQNNQDLPIPRIFLAALQLKRYDLETVQVALETSARTELPNLRRFNTVFDTVITVAPLLGLLGTVLGLMTSFASLKLGAVSQSDTIGVTGGISEALSSTVLGLVVAIVTLLFANMFRSFSRRQISAINSANGRLELFLRESHCFDP